MNLYRIFAVAVMSAALVAPAASAQTPAANGYDETGVLPNIPPKQDVVPPPQGGVLGDDRDGGTEGTVPDGRPPSVSAEPNPTTPPVTRETGAAPPVQAGTLPFTGLDVGIVALLGMLLVGTGFALRRTRTN